MPITRALVTLSLVAGLVVATAPPVAAADDSITFHGGGWGHGVGMSQYGAYGQAVDGRSAAEILTHYYTGASVVDVATVTAYPEPMWIGLIQNVTFVDFIMRGGAGALCLAGDGLPECPILGEPQPPERQANENERWRFRTVDEGGVIRCQFAKESPPGSGVYEPMGPNGDCSAAISWGPQPAVKIELPNQARTYGRGVLRFRPAPEGMFHEVLSIPLEEYLYGIAETLNHWPDAALQAQAIAARSYAISRANSREPSPNPETFDPDFSQSRKDLCWCHLYDDTRDQSFVGWVQENVPAWHAAVDISIGQVVAYAGDIVTTFYSSSTYGKTEPVEVGFGGAPIPYLKSVDDHWSADPAINPNASWSKTISLESLADSLGMGSVTTAAITAYSVSGAASEITFFGEGGPLQKKTRDLRTLLGLKSPQITGMNVPSLAGPDGVGLHDPRTGLWHLNTKAGTAVSFYYGNPLDIPYAGDWNGDGVTTLGLYRQSTGFLFLRNSNTQGVADINIYYGDPGDLPIAGDWDGDGVETVGIFRPSEAKVYLRNSNTQGVGDLSFLFGQAGDIPLAGNWTGNGRDTVALWRPSSKQVFFDYGLDGVADFVYMYTGAQSTDRLVAGDWNGDGVDTIGVYRPGDAAFYLRDTFTQTAANIIIEMGEGHMSPVAGAWGF